MYINNSSGKMRVYCSSTTHLNGVPEKIKPFFVIDRAIIHILTKDDVLLLEDNNIYRVKESAKPIKKTMIGVFTVSLKEEVIKTLCYQILPKSKQETTLHKVFKLSLQSVLEWIFVYKQNKLLENYFSLPEGIDINDASVKAELLQFL